MARNVPESGTQPGGSSRRAWGLVLPIRGKIPIDAVKLMLQ